MLTFIIGYCCYLQSSRFLRVCNASSISAATGSTTGTDFLELCVGWSMIVPEFQIHPGTDNFLAAISLSETRRNHKGPNRVSREGGGATAMYLVAKICCTC
jgi:hypothetical protein